MSRVDDLMAGGVTACRGTSISAKNDDRYLNLKIEMLCPLFREAGREKLAANDRRSRSQARSNLYLVIIIVGIEQIRGFATQQAKYRPNPHLPRRRAVLENADLLGGEFGFRCQPQRSSP